MSGGRLMTPGIMAAIVLSASAVIAADQLVAPTSVTVYPRAEGASPHAYFNQLAARPDVQVTYSLRDDAQLDKYRLAEGAHVVYDPVMQAARWPWLANQVNGDQIRLPIMLNRPASGSSSLLIISDHFWDSAWLTEFANGWRFVGGGSAAAGWKWLQVTSGSGATNTRQRIWFEPQMRWIGEVHTVNATINNQTVRPFAQTTPRPLSLFSAREYLGAVAPSTGGDQAPVACGINYGGDSLGPMQSCFAAYPNFWTRAWIQLKVTAGQTYTEISWWMADEQQGPTPILLGARQVSYPPHTEFWIEYNTSYETRLGGPMNAWARNIVVLKDVADVTPLLVRPKR